MKLKVPLIEQTNDTECWYAAIRMVISFRIGQGPVKGLPDLYEKPRFWRKGGLKGLGVDDMRRLAKAEGLDYIPIPPEPTRLTAQQLETFLMNYGPLWCAGEWGKEDTAHVIVLTGVEQHAPPVGDKLYFNDPSGYECVQTVDWFNDRQFLNKYALMYLPKRWSRAQ